jgi:hypothetical protein
MPATAGRRTAPAVTIFYLGLTSAGFRYATSVAGEAFDKLAVGDEGRFVAQHSESAKGLAGEHRIAHR